MTRTQEIQACLAHLSEVLHEEGFWQSGAPDSSAFASSEPFCVDTMIPEAWLQWIFLPRMQALLEAGAPLPEKMAIAPYYEMALESTLSGRDRLLDALRQLDRLFEPDYSC